MGSGMLSLGVQSSRASNAVSWTGADDDSWGVMSDGSVWHAGTHLGNIALNLSTHDIVELTLDRRYGNLRLFRNGADFGEIANGLSGDVLPSLALYGNGEAVSLLPNSIRSCGMKQTCSSCVVSHLLMECCCPELHPECPSGSFDRLYALYTSLSAVASAITRAERLDIAAIYEQPELHAMHNDFLSWASAQLRPYPMRSGNLVFFNTSRTMCEAADLVLGTPFNVRRFKLLINQCVRVYWGRCSY